MRMHTDVATVDVMERRLREWAEWRGSGGVAAGAFPTKNILHASWMPPTGPGLPGDAVGSVNSRQERQMESLVRLLPVKLRNAVCVVYLLRAPAVRQVEMLGCKEAAVRARIIEAKRRLAAWL